MYVSHPSAAHPLRPHGCRRPLMKNACHAKMPLIVWHRCSLVRPWVGGVVDVRPRKTAHYNKTFYRNAVTIHPSIHPSFHLSICFRVHLPPEGKKKGEGGGGVWLYHSGSNLLVCNFPRISPPINQIPPSPLSSFGFASHSFPPAARARCVRFVMDLRTSYSSHDRTMSCHTNLY